MAEESIVKEITTIEVEEGAGKDATELQLKEVIEDNASTQQNEGGSDLNIVPITLFSEKPEPEGSSMRRKSAGNREGRTLPIYLRASTGSCHDFCKFGKEQTFLKKEKTRRIRPIIVRDEEPILVTEDEVKKVVVRERKKKEVMKPEPKDTSPKLRDEHSNSVKTIKQKDAMKPGPKHTNPKLRDEHSNSSETIKQKALKPVQKSEVIVKPTISSMSKLKQLSGKSASSHLNPASILGRRSSPSSGGMKTLIRLSSLRKNRAGPVHVSKSLGGSSHGKVVNEMPNDSERRIGQKKSDGMSTKTGVVSKAVEQKTKKSSTMTSSTKPTGAAPMNVLKSRKTKTPSLTSKQIALRKPKSGEEKARVRTLHTIDSKSDRRTSPSSTRSQSSRSLSSASSHDNETVNSESTLSGTEGSSCEQEHTETSNQRGVMENGAKSRARQTKSTRPEDKDVVSEKLAFRRGRVVSLQSDNNGPRRLRFRQGRVVAEHQNIKGDTGKRSFRRRKESGAGESGKDNAEAHVVVLRHQDVQGRKEEQGLLNVVIEETANKLVETRKSKVKALVGAFETVISLQESKTVTTT